MQAGGRSPRRASEARDASSAAAAPPCEKPITPSNPPPSSARRRRWASSCKDGSVPDHQRCMDTSWPSWRGRTTGPVRCGGQPASWQGLEIACKVMPCSTSRLSPWSSCKPKNTPEGCLQHALDASFPSERPCLCFRRGGTWFRRLRSVCVGAPTIWKHKRKLPPELGHEGSDPLREDLPALLAPVEAEHPASLFFRSDHH